MTRTRAVIADELEQVRRSGRGPEGRRRYAELHAEMCAAADAETAAFRARFTPAERAAMREQAYRTVGAMLDEWSALREATR